MIKKDSGAQIFLTGISVDDLLLQVGQIIDAKISVTPKIENSQPYYLSRKEVAKLLKITLPTLHDWTQLGRLKAYKIGTRVLYKPEEVRDALEKSLQFRSR